MKRRVEVNGRFGKLTVIRHLETDKKGRKIWECECECGGMISKRVDKLDENGNCGCDTSSIGEKNIARILTENGIRFATQYTFADCKNLKELPFDFAVFDSSDKLTHLIEFDGRQHYEVVEKFGGEEGFRQTQANDQIKTNYCQANGIPLIRIHYSKRDKMEISDLVI